MAAIPQVVLKQAFQPIQAGEQALLKRVAEQAGQRTADEVAKYETAAGRAAAADVALYSAEWKPRFPGNAAERAKLNPYERAVAGIERRIQAERQLEVVGEKFVADAQAGKAAATTGPKLGLQKYNESLLLTQADPSKVRGTVIVWHGYTSWSGEFMAVAKKLHAEGYNVYVPRLAGHGFVGRDGMITGERVIKAGERQKWDQFIHNRMGEVKALNDGVDAAKRALDPKAPPTPIYELGESGGGALALRAAQTHPEIQKGMVLVPFVGPDRSRSFYLTNALEFLDKISFGLVGKVMDRIPRSKKNGMADPFDVSPHTQANLGSGLAIASEGRKARDIHIPIQLVTTTDDQAAGVASVRQVYRHLDPEKTGWFHITPELFHGPVPHAMASPMQNPNLEQVNWLHQAVVDFFNGGKLKNRLPQE